MNQSMKRPLIGCIADDFTGATDLSGLLRRSGISVVQCFGVPTHESIVSDFDAVVVALKSRSIKASVACEQSCHAARWLESLGCERFFFKYCSTFDSTPAGNIGPVAEALMDFLDVHQSIFCPSFPENGRTVYRGHLFVGDQLLNECGMQHHPLNPMTDANLVRVLAAQSVHEVGLVPRPPNAPSAAGSVATYMKWLADAPPLVIADAIDHDDLRRIAESICDRKLVTGGSAIAGAIAKTLFGRGLGGGPATVTRMSPIVGNAVVLAGSCSLATQTQVQDFVHDHASLTLDVQAACDGEAVLEHARNWIEGQPADRPFLISTTVDPSSLAKIQATHGREKSSAVAEALLSEIATFLVDRGIRRIVVAGGETAGAIVQRLGIEAVRIGDEIAPGVPWTEAVGQLGVSPDAPLELALKSGNFGSNTFFRDAIYPG